MAPEKTPLPELVNDGRSFDKKWPKNHYFHSWFDYHHIKHISHIYIYYDISLTTISWSNYIFRICIRKNAFNAPFSIRLHDIQFKSFSANPIYRTPLPKKCEITEIRVRFENWCLERFLKHHIVDKQSMKANVKSRFFEYLSVFA